MKKKNSGFTIVELLIVIVVIAILAAISVVAYQGIQRRSANTAIISAAQQSYKLIQLYTAQYGDYPTVGIGPAMAGWRVVCLTRESGCQDANGVFSIESGQVHDTVAERLAEFGEVPQVMLASGGGRRGIMFHHDPVRRVNGQNHTGVLLYYLQGTSQKCGMDRVLSDWSGELTWSTTGYTVANSVDGDSSPTPGVSSGSTACVISIER